MHFDFGNVVTASKRKGKTGANNGMIDWNGWSKQSTDDTYQFGNNNNYDLIVGFPLFEACRNCVENIPCVYNVVSCQETDSSIQAYSTRYQLNHTSSQVGFCHVVKPLAMLEHIRCAYGTII
jgi:hypothetical protein